MPERFLVNVRREGFHAFLARWDEDLIFHSWESARGDTFLFPIMSL